MRWVGLLLALSLAAPAIAQNDWPVSGAQRRHVHAVRAQRSAVFFDEWSRATAAARSRAAAHLQAGSGTSGPSGRFPDLALLTQATRVLRGREPGERDALQRFADQLDLEVVPGYFFAADEGRGAALTVRVYQLETTPRPSETELSLVWIAPDGAEPTAMSEPFAGEAFSTPGFEMFPRAPISEAGQWRLVPIVRDAGREVRGAAVPVECVDASLLGRGDVGEAKSGEPAWRTDLGTRTAAPTGLGLARGGGGATAGVR
jgi:hypothetical protein